MGDGHFPRTSDLPPQSPMYWVGQKDRYLRQQMIRDIEALTGRRLIVYFANRFRDGSGIDAADPAYLTELLSDVGDEPVDLLIETNGGATDATEALISILQLRVADLRVVIANAAKSNGTLICLAASTIVMGPSSELGPIDPHLNGIPCTVLVQPQVALTNFPLQQLAELALKQTRKLATRLLDQGMMNGRSGAEIDTVVNALATRETYFSHGSTIDHIEAASLGLKIDACAHDDPIWSRIWLLYCMYDYDTRRDNLIKVFEGRARSTSVAAPAPAAP
ncbi:hypothetical protein KZ810_13245 [Sphingomonas sp. RHCKR47]|uniref:SDH family Clp fold serine proteinase n=1 Tax=Sphingomonas citricola TaxID=2862498 RepID=UPI001CA56A6B|nr:hypothetical protein [Sphingomonas citricola]MBW6524468.1 hypothetical protein [Sphingomonas citricola]